jgi:hypothetical protein
VTKNPDRPKTVALIEPKYPTAALQERLYIFNFKTMIKKTLACTLLLMISYHFVLETNTGNSWSVSQHQWQDNIIKAEHFMFSITDSIDGVIC